MGLATNPSSERGSPGNREEKHRLQHWSTHYFLLVKMITYLCKTIVILHHFFTICKSRSAMSAQITKKINIEQTGHSLYYKQVQSFRVYCLFTGQFNTDVLSFSKNKKVVPYRSSQRQTG